MAAIQIDSTRKSHVSVADSKPEEEPKYIDGGTHAGRQTVDTQHHSTVNGWTVNSPCSLVLNSSVMSGALARLLFYPTLAYNVVLEKVSSRRWFDRVDETVILGALPFRSMTKQLVETEDVRGVITMNETYETKYFCNSAEEWRAAGVEQLRLSTVDLTGVPSLENLHRGVEFALHHREQGTSVYVHCKAGRSRSATLAAAYLIRLHCWTPEEACQKLASVRPHILVRSAQLEVLRTYYQDVCGQSS